MNTDKPFFLQKDNVYAVPAIHYNMECAAQVRLAYEAIKPDCVAVELAETMTLQLLHAASRLPNISVVIAYNQDHHPIYYMCEPCDPAFEALRSALENQVAAHCIDLDIDYYPEIRELLPDPYAIQKIGLRQYYELYIQSLSLKSTKKDPVDEDREMYMARRLKELALRHEKVLFVGGMSHVQNVLDLLPRTSFPTLMHAKREVVEICTPTEESLRELMAECGWISLNYEKNRSIQPAAQAPDRKKIIFQLYKEASEQYVQTTGNLFPAYHFRNLMKFIRNYALITGRLMPDLFQILSGARGCVDSNYAYETWVLATEYPYRSNVDGLPEIDLSIDDVWGNSKIIRFHLKQPGRKQAFKERRRKDKSKFRFSPPGPFTICSYPPEDIIVERFGEFLKKKGTNILAEESSRTIPFSTSLEEGVDTRETIRHWAEHKLYVKARGKPPGGVGSVVVIFDVDSPEEGKGYQEKYQWRATWLGEHSQESDMALYATPLTANVVGPGISRCEYGGFMMSSPPRRMFDIWNDPDYHDCRTKAEVLLAAAIDYAVKPLIVYVAAKPPRSALKSFAKRFGKKIIYIPIGQLSPVTLNKLRVFHVLDGYDKREIADEYIY